MKLRLSLRDEDGREIAFRVRTLTFDMQPVPFSASYMSGVLKSEEYRLGMDAREMYRDASYKLFGSWPPAGRLKQHET